MICDQYKPWLIEVNCSPSMEYSTPIVKELIKELSHDIIKVLLD